MNIFLINYSLVDQSIQELKKLKKLSELEQHVLAKICQSKVLSWYDKTVKDNKHISLYKSNIIIKIGKKSPPLEKHITKV